MHIRLQLKFIQAVAKMSKRLNAQSTQTAQVFYWNFSTNYEAVSKIKCITEPECKKINTGYQSPDPIMQPMQAVQQVIFFSKLLVYIELNWY